MLELNYIMKYVIIQKNPTKTNLFLEGVEILSVTTYILFDGRMYVMLNVVDISQWVKDKLMSCHALVCILVVK